MKFLIFASFLCVASAVVTDKSFSQSSCLTKDLGEFVALLPINEIVKVDRDYMENDKEHQKTLKYIQSQEFMTILEQIRKNKQFQKLVDYLESAGIPAKMSFKLLAVHLHWHPYYTLKPLNDDATRTKGLSGYIEDIISVLPREQLREMFDEKLETSNNFNYMYEKLASDDFLEILQLIQSDREMSLAFEEMKNNGVDIVKLIELIKSIFGWQ